jgi:glyoxylase-like metal-dependent hydrolase (beta-lactamase superfamily II)
MFTDDFSNEENACIILTEEGPVVIDTLKSEKSWKVIDNFIKESGFSEPIAIIYTHWHIDHTFGYQKDFVLCPVYAHKKTADYLKTFEETYLQKSIAYNIVEPNTKILYPTIWVEDQLTLKLGGFEFELISNPGHTEDSIIIFEKNTGVLIAGDTLMSDVNHILLPPPLPFDYGVKCTDLIPAMDVIEKKQPTFIIPGHGTQTDPEMLFSINRTYVNTLLNTVKSALDNNISLASIKKIMPKNLFTDEQILKTIDQNFMIQNLTTAYKCLSASKN